MKHIVFSVLLAVAFPVFGQAKPEATKPEAAKPEAKASPKPAVARKVSPRRHEDARQCLERATNNEIIKCAEEYL